MLKKNPTEKYLKDKKYFMFIGIARDEEKRHKIKPENVIHPLYDWNITEKQALDYCYSKGFDWGGLYKNFNRVSCWCCPLKSLSELRSLRKLFPDLWLKLLDMDNRSYNRFKKDYSVKFLDEKFNKEDEYKSKCISLF